MNDMKISAIQLFQLLFVVRFFNFLVNAPFYAHPTNSSVTLVSMLAADVIIYAMLIILFCLYKKHSGQSFFIMSSSVLKGSGEVFLFVYGIFFLVVSVTAIVDNINFITAMILPDASKILFSALMSLTAVYAFYLGIEPIARANTFAFWAVIASVVFIVFNVANSIQISNLMPLYKTAFNDYACTTVKSMSGYSEIVLLVALMPFVTGGIKPAYTAWVFAGTVLVGVMQIAQPLVLGEYANTQMFPFYVLAHVSKTSVFENLDALYMFIWVIAALIKASVFFYARAHCLQSAFKGKAKKFLPPICAVLLVVFACVLPFSESLYHSIERVSDSSILFLILAFILPALITVAVKIKEGNKREK